jgi:hypothetical protein
MTPRSAPARLSLVALLAAGCSFSRFDEVREDGPVVFLNKPGNLQAGFGPVITTGTLDGEPRLIVGGEHGTSPAAIFAPGSYDAPNLDALRSNLCTGSGTFPCFLAPQVAYLPRTQKVQQDPPEATGCVAVGIGYAALEEAGVLFECEDGSSFSRPVLTTRQYNVDVQNALEDRQDEPIALAVDGTDDPPLVVGAPSIELAWYYEPSAEVPIRLTPPVGFDALPPGFGTAVAAIRVAENDWLFAVNAQGDGELHLFRAQGSRARYLGCLGGTPDFGRRLVAGPVPGPDTPEIGDDVADLVVSDRSTVFVFDGAKLATLPAVPTDQEGYTCTLAALPERTLLSSFGCGSTPQTSECSSSDFGSALALGDLDGDGDNEVIVGAPQMTVRGEHGAGAILSYDVDAIGDDVLHDVRYLAQGERGDALGGSVAAISIGSRDVIVGGAIRSGKVGLFFCSDMVPGNLRGPRCE